MRRSAALTAAAIISKTFNMNAKPSGNQAAALKTLVAADKAVGSQVARRWGARSTWDAGIDAAGSVANAIDLVVGTLPWGIENHEPTVDG